MPAGWFRSAPSPAAAFPEHAARNYSPVDGV